MLKSKKILIMILGVLLIILIPNMVKAETEISVTRNVYSNDGSMRFQFTNLELDTTHEYKFGLTKTTGETVEDWYSILEYTENSATVDITARTTKFMKVIRSVENGYITIKDITVDEIVLDHYKVNLTLPFLNVTNYTVVNNGKSDWEVKINLWSRGNSTAYYQYEKITDENVISRFKEIKSNNGDYNELQPLLKTTVPTSNWAQWSFWNGFGDDGFGVPENTVNAPDYGLYYLWIYCSGNNMRNLYGYILVDNLQPEIALDSISLPSTKEVELGKTLTLTPVFSPVNTTNKIVTWSSSDESVATVDNAGKVTPKKIGSTIITVTSQDGNKRATCTVTVIAEQELTPETTTATLSSISITKAPTKTSYKEGDKFDKTGMVVTAKYSDGTTKKVTGYTYSPAGALKATDTKITVTYKEGNVTKTAEQTIKVAKQTVEANQNENKNVNDTTVTKQTSLPNTGRTLVFWIISIALISAVIAYVRDKKLSI